MLSRNGPTDRGTEKLDKRTARIRECSSTPTKEKKNQNLTGQKPRAGSPKKVFRGSRRGSVGERQSVGRLSA